MDRQNNDPSFKSLPPALTESYPSHHELSHHELIHLLNQRYKEQWDRAERLQSELNDIRGSRAWRVLNWLRGIKQRLARKTSVTAARSTHNILKLPRPAFQPRCKVSIVIPFRNQYGLLRELLRSVRLSTYRNREIILVDNGSTCRGIRRLTERLNNKKRMRVLRINEPFNFSRLCNAGAALAVGEFLLFLNNDMQVLARDWLEQLLRLVNLLQVGIAGATLLYPDGTIQHAGIFPDSAGEWHHRYRGFPDDYSGEHGELSHPREVPAVTGACLMIERKLFQEVGGFNEQLPVTGNDVDLCLRIRQRGLVVGITPLARLMHYESLSRGYARDDSSKALNELHQPLEQTACKLP